MARLDDLAKEVEETEGAAESAKVAVQGLRDEIKALAGQMENPADQQKIDEFVARLDAAQSKIAQAVAAHSDGGGSRGGSPE